MPEGKFTEVIFLTHAATLGEMLSALDRIARLPYVTGLPVSLRVEKL